MRLSLEHSTADLMRDVADTLSNLQISMAETLERVHDERLSLSRFGDGEILLATTPEHNIGFQQSTPQLRKDLVAALNPDWLASGRVMVTLPPPFVGSLHWLGVWIKVWRDLSNLLHHDKQYGNTLVSRPSFFQEEGEAGVAQWRRLWAGRPILIVTGKGSRFDLLPSMFDSARAVEFVYSAPVNAYSQIDEVYEETLKRAGRDTLVLLSLGPTATILAHRFASEGLQALDVGHLSASYDFVYKKAPLPEKLPLEKMKII